MVRTHPEPQNSMKIYVATQNQKKIDLVKKVFSESFSNEELVVVGCDAQSDVSGTPQSDQNFIGSHNRALNAKKIFLDGEYYVGLETGLVERSGNIYEETWCTVLDSSGTEKYSYSSGNVVSKDLQPKYEIDEKTNSKTLKVIDDSGEYVPYSGKIEIREIEIENAIMAALSQFVK